MICKDIPTWLRFLNLGSWHHTCVLCEIAASKTVWKIIWSTESLHSDRCDPYADKKHFSLVEWKHQKWWLLVQTSLSRTYQKRHKNVVLNFNKTTRAYSLYHWYTKTDFGDENISHRLNISMNTVIDHRTNKHDIRRFRVRRNAP